MERRKEWRRAAAGRVTPAGGYGAGALQQRARGGDSIGQIGYAKCTEIAAAELLGKSRLRIRRIELPWRKPAG